MGFEKIFLFEEGIHCCIITMHLEVFNVSFFFFFFFLMIKIINSHIVKSMLL